MLPFAQAHHNIFLPQVLVTSSSLFSRLAEASTRAAVRVDAVARAREK